MQIKLPKPFFFEEGKRAVLLLHGFTGNSSDVRQLGRFLQKKGYTSYAPQYEGHAAPPEEILQSSPFVWFKDALDGYDYLVEQGYDEIVVAGLSLGGDFALKLSLNRDVKGIVTMCAPMGGKTEGAIYEGFLEYARNFKKYEGKDQETIDNEMHHFKPTETLKELSEALDTIKDQVDEVFDPILVIQAENDNMIDPQSANYIYEHVDSDEKDINGIVSQDMLLQLIKKKNKFSMIFINF